MRKGLLLNKKKKLPSVLAGDIDIQLALFKTFRLYQNSKSMEITQDSVSVVVQRPKNFSHINYKIH